MLIVFSSEKNWEGWESNPMQLGLEASIRTIGPFIWKYFQHKGSASNFIPFDLDLNLPTVFFFFFFPGPDMTPINNSILLTVDKQK